MRAGTFRMSLRGVGGRGPDFIRADGEGSLNQLPKLADLQRARLLLLAWCCWRCLLLGCLALLVLLGTGPALLVRCPALVLLVACYLLALSVWLDLAAGAGVPRRCCLLFGACYLVP